MLIMAEEYFSQSSAYVLDYALGGNRIRMSLSVLLIQNTGVPEDIKVMLESKIPHLTLAQYDYACLQLLSREELLQKLKPFDLVFFDNKKECKKRSLQPNKCLYWKNISDLSSKIDVYLQLRRCLALFPLNLKHWVLVEVLHNSQDCIIYRGVNKKGESAAIKRFKFKPNELSDEMIQKFLERVERQCAIRSEGLVHFYDGGICNHAFYLVMEYLEFGTLRQALNNCERSLPLLHALEWFREITSALDCVHNANLIHRDLKIDNVMLRSDGVLALTDYGVSKRILLDAGFLKEDELHCSPHYVSPELVAGEDCTKASDIYSLGVIFYELLMGEKPFAGNSPTELMMQHVMAPIPILDESIAHLQPVLNKMMAKCPDDRFLSPGKALKMLESLLRKEPSYQYEQHAPPTL
ncbi:hypothetical protein GCM10009133_03540 [Cocleimonas flava]